MLTWGLYCVAAVCMGRRVWVCSCGARFAAVADVDPRVQNFDFLDQDCFSAHPSQLSLSPFSPVHTHMHTHPCTRIHTQIHTLTVHRVPVCTLTWKLRQDQNMFVQGLGDNPGCPRFVPRRPRPWSPSVQSPAVVFSRSWRHWRVMVMPLHFVEQNIKGKHGLRGKIGEQRTARARSGSGVRI